MSENVFDIPGAYYGLLILIILCHFGLGKKFIDSGIWGTSIFGFLVAAIPTAILCNVSAQLVKYSIVCSAFVSCFFTLKFLRAHIDRGALKKFLICLVLACVVFFTNYYFNGQLQFQNNDTILSYNGHDSYFSSVIMEMLEADYFSRTKMLTVFPLEWGNYHFFNAASLARLQYFLPHNNLFSYYFSHLALISFVVAAIFEKCLTKNDETFLKIVKAIFFLFILFTFFGKNTGWNLMTNGAISFLAIIMAILSWPSRKNSIFWMLFVGFSVSRLVPFAVLSLIFLFLEHYWKLIQDRVFNIYFENLKKDIKRHYKFVLLVVFFIIYTFLTAFPKYKETEFMEGNTFHDSWLSPLLFYRLLAELSVFKLHFTTLDSFIYGHFSSTSFALKMFTLLQVFLGAVAMLVCPFYILKESKKVIIFWIVIVLSAFIANDAPYMALISLLYFSLAYILTRDDQKLCFAVLGLILACHLLQITGVNAVKGPMTSIIYDVLIGGLILKRFLAEEGKLRLYFGGALLLMGFVAYPTCLFPLKLPQDMAISFNHFSKVKKSFDDSSQKIIVPKEFIKIHPELSPEKMAAFSVIYGIPLQHDAEMPNLSTRHARVNENLFPRWFRKYFIE